MTRKRIGTRFAATATTALLALSIYAVPTAIAAEDAFGTDDAYELEEPAENTANGPVVGGSRAASTDLDISNFRIENLSMHEQETGIDGNKAVHRYIVSGTLVNDGYAAAGRIVANFSIKGSTNGGAPEAATAASAGLVSTTPLVHGNGDQVAFFDVMPNESRDFELVLEPGTATLSDLSMNIASASASAGLSNGKRIARNDDFAVEFGTNEDGRTYAAITNNTGERLDSFEIAYSYTADNGDYEQIANGTTAIDDFWPGTTRYELLPETSDATTDFAFIDAAYHVDANASSASLNDIFPMDESNGVVEIANNSGQSLADVSVSYTATDEDGNLVSGTRTYTDLNVAPGATFEIEIAEGSSDVNVHDIDYAAASGNAKSSPSKIAGSKSVAKNTGAKDATGTSKQSSPKPGSKLG